MEVKIHLTVSRTGLKQLMNQQIERYNKDVIYFDLYFDEDKLYAKVDSSSNEAPIKYKDLKKINETNDIDYSLVIAPVVAELCTTSVALSAPPNSYQNNSQS